MQIRTDNLESVKPFLKKLYRPAFDSHKGQNGKVLIIGGSSLFHAASIWAAEVASHFVDMVHYSSTEENMEIFKDLKKKFRGGIVVPQKDLENYIEEDDVILIGPGMVREFPPEEAKYAQEIVKKIADKFPQKRIVMDAGALQVLNPKTLLKFKKKPILTPHQKEFERLFGIDVSKMGDQQTAKTVNEKAREFNCIIVLKKVSIFISDGEGEYIVEGGNAGLTKGGTGDVLAGLIASFYAKNDAVMSSILAAWVLKRTAETLFLTKGYWYNINNLIENIADTLYSSLKEANL